MRAGFLLAGAAFLALGALALSGTLSYADRTAAGFLLSGAVLLQAGLLARVDSIRLAFSVAWLVFLFPVSLLVIEWIGLDGVGTAPPQATRIERIRAEGPDGGKEEEPNILRSGIYLPHGTFGWVHLPGSQGSHATENFDVTYTIDALGNRVTDRKSVV